MITVVNKKTNKPANIDIYVGRGSILGNKFTHKNLMNTKAEVQCSCREEAVQMYESWLVLEVRTNQLVKDELNRIFTLAKSGNVNLVCYCKPLSCHADVIKKLIDSKLNNK
jgi:hypothetical protein